MWQVTSVDTITGEVIGRFYVSSFTWERKLSAGANMECRVPLDGQGYSRDQWRDLTKHWSCTIVLEHDSGVVAAGIVRTWTVEDRTMVLGLTDLWGLWERRGAWSHLAPQSRLWSTTYTSVTLGTIAKKTVQLGMSGFPSPNLLPSMALPMTLPADVSGSITRKYYGYRFEFVADVLDDLLLEGLDIDFRPRWVDGKLDWEMRNDPAENSWEWHVNAPGGGVAGFREVSDGSRMTNNSYLIGEGEEQAMVARSQRNITSDLPLLDRLEPRKAVSDENQASAIATQLLAQYAAPTVSYSFEVLASGDPAVGDMRLGDSVRLWFDSDPWWTDGAHDLRIVKLNGGLGEKITVTCQSTGGA